MEVSIDPLLPPFSQTNFGQAVQQRRRTPGRLPRSERRRPRLGVVEVALAPGTDVLDLIDVAWPDAGVTSWAADVSAIGTVDGYDAVGASTHPSLPGFVVNDRRRQDADRDDGDEERGVA
jgi:hypothetical protein